MGTIRHAPDNVFERPKGSFIRNGSYVYVNTSNFYVKPEEKKQAGTRGYTGYKSVCIGVLEKPNNPDSTTFFANQTYREMIGLCEQLPTPPVFNDCIAVGLTDLIGVVAEQSGLTELLTEAFGEDDTKQILDLACYMMSKESAVMQSTQVGPENMLSFLTTSKTIPS